MSQKMKGTLSCIRLSPIMQAMFGIEGTKGARSKFGKVSVEFNHYSVFTECTASYSEKIEILSVNGVPMEDAISVWADSECCLGSRTITFNERGNTFIIYDITLAE